MSHEHLKAWMLEELLSYELSPYAWVQVPQFWDYLVRYKPSFKPKAYGYKNIRILLQAFPELFQLRPYKGQENVHEVLQDTQQGMLSPVFPTANRIQ